MVRRRLLRLRAWLLGHRGFNLVILTMSITVLNIMVAVALPLMSQQIQRDKEAELIFRGLQYAEAIRVFQQRQGRLPVRMEELLEVEPRSIRQLWKNPMNDDGTWALILQTQAGRPGRPGGGNQPVRPGQPPPSGTPPPPSPDAEPVDDGSASELRPVGAAFPGGPGGVPGGGTPPVPTFTPGQDPTDLTGGSGAQVTIAPIQGVYDPEGSETVITFFGDNQTSAWRFTTELLQPQQGGIPGRPGAGANNGRPPLPPNAGTLGKPFPPGITPPALGGGAGANPGLRPRPGGGSDAKPGQERGGGRSR